VRDVMTVLSLGVELHPHRTIGGRDWEGVFYRRHRWAVATAYLIVCPSPFLLLFSLFLLVLSAAALLLLRKLFLLGI
jgi:hypothetical protein